MAVKFVMNVTIHNHENHKNYKNVAIYLASFLFVVYMRYNIIAISMFLKQRLLLWSRLKTIADHCFTFVVYFPCLLLNDVLFGFLRFVRLNSIYL
jgi:hypothetical protein